MKKIYLIVILCFIAMVITGCDNNIYYYEKDNEQINNSDINNILEEKSYINEDNYKILNEPFFYIFEESVVQDTKEIIGTYIGKGTENDGKEFIKIKHTVGNNEIWSYQTPSFYITDLFSTSSVDVFYSTYSKDYEFDSNYSEFNYYNIYIKENNIIKLFNLKNGKIIWTSDELDITPTSIIETQDHLYVVNDEIPYIYVIDINNGKLVNKIRIDNSGFYFIKEIIHNRLIIQTHYETPIIEEINLDNYSNIYTEYELVSSSFFKE